MEEHGLQNAPITVGILAFEGVDELDLAGPLDVFSYASWGFEGDRVVVVANSREPLRGGNGLQLIADHDLSDAPPIDVLVIPGGHGAMELAQDKAVLDWIRGVAASALWVCSVCTGSFVLHAAGLAAGRKITTHSFAIEQLREAGAEQVIEGERYVVDGNLVTAAGVSAGIDMALWVVGQVRGEDHTRSVQASLEYYPAPPYCK